MITKADLLKLLKYTELHTLINFTQTVAGLLKLLIDTL